MCQRVQDALIEIPVTKIRIEHDTYDFLIPTTLIGFNENWRGPSRDEVLRLMLEGETPIYMYQLSSLDEFGVDPTNLSEEELETVICKLRSVLLTSVD